MASFCDFCVNNQEINFICIGESLYKIDLSILVIFFQIDYYPILFGVLVHSSQELEWMYKYKQITKIFSFLPNMK